MDPLSISASAAAILAVCLQTVHLLQETIETVKNASRLLIKLLAQTERLRLILEHLRSLTKQLGSRSGFLLSYNDSAPKMTIRELNALVTRMAQKGNSVSLQMLMNKGKVEDLVERMKKHEQEVLIVLMSIAAASAVRTETEIMQMHEATKAQSEVITLFENFHVSAHNTSGRKVNPSNNVIPTDDSTSSSSNNNPSRNETSHETGTSSRPPAYSASKPLQIWFGDTYREGFSEDYLHLRDELSGAAFRGDFETVFRVLKLAEEQYGESWVNAPRLSFNPAETSGWAPIHQAAFMSATTIVVQQLVELGASRTLRTNWADSNEFLYKDMCALEIALEHGYSHLVETLAPRVKNTVPHTTLEKVQNTFHDIIRSDLVEFENQDKLRLPELSVLTDMELPEMWFPLKSLDRTDPNSPRGYLYRLDGRELVVKIFNVRHVVDSRMYRISSTGVREIAEGVIFDAGSRKE